MERVLRFTGPDFRSAVKRPAPAMVPGEPAPLQSPPPAPRGRRRWRRFCYLGLGALLVVLGVLAWGEARSSRGQAWLLTRMSEGLAYRVEAGPGPGTPFPSGGPYDLRLGYAGMPGMLARLDSLSYEITAQARLSPELARVVERGLYPPYREKPQAGLRIVDGRGLPIFEARYPKRVYAAFDSIPPVVRSTLLLIENRELLDERHPYRNPAVEWDRFTLALFEQALRLVHLERKGPGASTLATQLEKFRHAPGGRTESRTEKLRQMASASLRSYLDGKRTLPARRRIVQDYLNAVPLAAVRGYGEVIGLAEGLEAWYGADFDEVNRALRAAADSTAPVRAGQGAAYRQVLGLLLAARRPSYYLAQPEGRRALDRLTDSYLGLLSTGGVISPQLRDAARAARVAPRSRAMPPEAGPAVDWKATNAIRPELLGLLGAGGLYDLDRLDLDVRSTLDWERQKAVTRFLQGLTETAALDTAGLLGARLLGRGDPEAVSYAIVLYEQRPEGNLVRVQTDNFGGPFNINEGAKLELGSTAKLRTLVHYLEIVEALHVEHAGRSAAELRAVPVAREDRLTAWVIRYLADHPACTRAELLEAAMQRSYSASPAEQFFTGGGVHVFHNFEGKFGGSVLSVQEGLRHSVNLVFIRLMRDVVQYHLHRLPGDPVRMLADPADPRRQAYLYRFADREGRQFLDGFYARYHGRPAEEQLATAGRRATSATRLAWIFRAARPDAGPEALGAFLRAQGRVAVPSGEGLRALYERTDPGRFGWSDRGYLAGVHPLELWLVGYLQAHPQATRAEVTAASAALRREVYGWLFKSRNVAGQNRRIRSLLEEDAFVPIHRAWQALGYPFGRLVPSYATAIGSSADRPAALAELVGIVLRGGMKYPVVRVEELRFAGGTPYETVLRREKPAPERVLSEEVAAVVRTALVDVVERGTARRVAGALRGADGEPLVVGGKTGTGDNRIQAHGPDGRLIESRVLNRTSTFVFFIGERFFGTVTVYVSGPRASGFGFTSSLPVQLLKTLGPTLRPLLDAPPPP